MKIDGYYIKKPENLKDLKTNSTNQKHCILILSKQ